ncbi:MAG TPA: sensor histidine kinase [Rhodanobacteraceae bacterium]|nr:sensor histidine kinase [Rhodanobacteraceae bacterium]
MLNRWFTVAPDSLAATLSRGRKHRWRVLWNLAWLPWVLGDLMFTVPLPAHWIPVTAASLIVFLGLYACALVRPRRETLTYALAIVALACLVMPVNRTGSGTYLIYACAYLAFQPSLRQAALHVAPALLIWALEATALQWPWQPTVWVLIVCIAIATGQCSMFINFLRNADLRLSHEEIRRLAATAERERIGRDLHDLLGHTLSMVTLKSELAGRLIERDPTAARREISDVERVARDALSQVRSAVSGIRAAALVSEFASARLLLETAGVQMEYWRGGRELPADIETCLALVLREAVTNIQRHARANRVEVTVIAGEERVLMRIRDDGRGGVNARGNGLTGMGERIVARGGELAIESPRGRGTSIEVSLPLPVAPAREIGRAAPAASEPLMDHAGSHA